MDLYNSLENVINFFIQPFLKALEKIGISDTPIKVGFSNIEWFSFSLHELVSLIGTYLILYLFFRIIYKLLKIFVKIITGGLIKWKNWIGYIN